MFRRFKNGGEIECPVIVVTDPHVTSPGQDEPAIIRNDGSAARAEGSSDLYERARQIYYRAKRSGRRRSAGII